MTLATYIPRKPLSDHVEMIWSWEGYHPPHARERILPAGMMEITINLSDTPFQIYAPAPQTINGPLVVGARSDYFVIDTSVPMSLLSVWFKPGGAMAFFGASAAELHNTHLSLDLLWGVHAVDVYHQLLEAPTTTERFRMLEAALLKRLRTASPRHRAVGYALRVFQHVPHPHSIAQIADQIALSQTRFIQVFRDEVGMTPKRFARLQRFHHALRLITDGRCAGWADVALACGYYDQSHLINDFQHFAGMSPTAYAPQSSDHNLNLPEPG